jgi:glycosyltransferase involved in cell wall biosynthesis
MKECIGSILQQTFQNLELIVLDNASTDGTTDWLRSIGDDRVKLYYSPESLTIEDNWKRALTVPKSTYMTLIGHDDILHPYFLAEINQLIEAHPEASLFTSRFTYIDSNGHVIREGKVKVGVQTPEGFLSDLLQNQVDIMGSGFVMRSADYEKLGGIPDYPSLLFADFELWFNLAKIGYKVVADKNLFAFRIHQSTTTVSADIKMQDAFGRLMYFLNSLKSDPKFNAVIKAHGIGFINFYCKGLAHRLLRTDKNKRGGLTVKGFLDQCRQYAELLVPGSNYNPEAQVSVKLAKWIDSTSAGRKLFLLFKRTYNKPLMR